jgi:hypothetical protein
MDGVSSRGSTQVDEYGAGLVAGFWRTSTGSTYRDMFARKMTSTGFRTSVHMGVYRSLGYGERNQVL